MTLPKVVSDLLILAPSFKRAPVAPVLFARSLPAKSTRLYIYIYVSHNPNFGTAIGSILPDTSYLFRFQVGKLVLFLLSQDDGEYSVRSRRRLVHIRSGDRASLNNSCA